MSKKLFVVSDVHNFYDEMMYALSEQGYDKNNPDHIFVLCGDLLDRGKQANKCLQFVNNLPSDRKVLIRGNHELLMDDILYKKKCFDFYDYTNGTANTIEQVTGITEQYNGHDASWVVQQTMIEDMRHNEQWQQYYNSTIMYAEIGQYIFVHGWIPDNKDWRNASYAEWKDATWLNGMAWWATGIIEPNKTIVCGHYHTSWGHYHIHDVGTEWNEDWLDKGDYAHFEPFEDDGIIAMDACVAYSRKINCKVLEVTDEEWNNGVK